MYERMLNKNKMPTLDEFEEYIGDKKDLFIQLNKFMEDELYAETKLRFPYGNSYGWGIKYFVKSKHICDVFAEKDAFTVMLRLTNEQFDSIYHELLAYTKKYIDEKYPCGEGGWIQYRVLSSEQLEDAEKLLRLKINKKS